MCDLDIPKFRTPKLKTPSLRRSLPRKRDLARAINFFNRSIREPVSAKIRRDVLARAKNKCQYPKCPIKEKGDIKLQIHHKNMVNDNSRLSNLVALCATHHGAIPRKYKVIHSRDLSGIRSSSKVVTKKTANRIKKQKKQNPFGLDF